ncbi:helix-turn-helix domain-containing protein [Alcaligenaceae bacterium]|nr:helix-turn-helix domain-containing protein [Alcaligenaceae bacterium]
MQIDQRPHPLEVAAQKFGSEAALARAIGASRGAMNQWKNPGREVPAKYAPKIEKLTGVHCELLCPSVDWSVVRRSIRRNARRRPTKDTTHPTAKKSAHV